MSDVSSECNDISTCVFRFDISLINKKNIQPFAPKLLYGVVEVVCVCVCIKFIYRYIVYICIGSI